MPITKSIGKSHMAYDERHTSRLRLGVSIGLCHFLAACPLKNFTCMTTCRNERSLVVSPGAETEDRPTPSALHSRAWFVATLNNDGAEACVVVHIRLGRKWENRWADSDHTPQRCEIRAAGGNDDRHLTHTRWCLVAILFFFFLLSKTYSHRWCKPFELMWY